MINTLSIFFMFITIIICFFLPIFLIIKFNKKYNVKSELFAAGFIVFLLFELFLRMPFLSLTTESKDYANAAFAAIRYALLMGFTAGLFDEIGRYLYYRVLARDHLSWENGVAMGIGFASMETMVVTGGVYARRFMFSIMLNMGRYGENPELQPIIDEITSVPSYMHLLAGLERLFMLFIHIALSVLTMYAAKSGKLKNLAAVVIIHGIIVSLAVYLNGFNIFLSQVYLLIVAVLSIFAVIKLKDKETLYLVPGKKK